MCRTGAELIGDASSWTAANPFVDPAGCRNYIATFEERYNAQLKLEAESR